MPPPAGNKRQANQSWRVAACLSADADALTRIQPDRRDRSSTAEGHFLHANTRHSDVLSNRKHQKKPGPPSVRCPMVSYCPALILVTIFGFSGTVCAPDEDVCGKFTTLCRSTTSQRLIRRHGTVGDAEGSGDAWLMRRCGQARLSAPTVGQTHAGTELPDTRVPPPVWGLRFEWHGRVQVLRAGNLH